MKDLAIKAVATSAEGFYYREEHEWRGLNDQMSVWFSAKLSELQARISKAAGGDGDVSATFDATIDGVQAPPLSVSGITRDEMSNFEQAFHDIGGELIRLGKEHAKRKHHK